MKNFIVVLIMSLMGQLANASFIASNKKSINPNLPTHIMISGQPDKLGELFVYSLLTRAKSYIARSADEQIIIVGRNDDRDLIKEAGFYIIAKGGGMLKPATISEAVDRVGKISSIDIYAHTSPISGAVIDSNTWLYQLFDEKDDVWIDVKSKLITNAFIFIHGCNAGINFAPKLAEKLKTAVFAALTSTDFEYFYQNSFWAGEQKIKQSPKTKKIVRMKPDNYSYRGYWGDWTTGGYPSYKLFCGSNNNEKCESGALEGILTFPSILKYGDAKLNLNNFKKQLTDFMCPYDIDSEKQKECAVNLEKQETKTYSPFEGNTLVCDLARCRAHFNCPSLKAAFNPSACTLETETKDESTTFVDEYNYFINIFKKLTKFEANNSSDPKND